MATSSDISVGLAHEFVITACKAGFEPEDLMVLARSEQKLRQVLQFTRGHAEVAVVKHIINLDADPFIPEGWTVEEHRRMGQFEWDPTKIQLYLSEHQKKKSIQGTKLYKELAEKLTFNANLLDDLLAHPHLIPEEWKGKVVFFWGTIYRDSDDRLYVRYLFWRGYGWGWSWLDIDWRVRSPAALHASSELGA